MKYEKEFEEEIYKMACKMTAEDMEESLPSILSDIDDKISGLSNGNPISEPQKIIIGTLFKCLLDKIHIVAICNNDEKLVEIAEKTLVRK